MSGIHKKLLLLTLVHPDFLPPVYSAAQTLRDEGYDIHILTFDSLVPSPVNIGKNIEIESLGKHHNVPAAQRLQLRKKFKQRAKSIMYDDISAIITFCPFSFLCGLYIKHDKPLAYLALEISDFRPSRLIKSPVSNLINYRALRQVHKADFLATPSAQRSAWMAGRCHLPFLPETICNSAYFIDKQVNDRELFENIVPHSFLSKKIILYTGRVGEHLAVFEIVKSFNSINNEDSALIITGINDSEYCNMIKAFASTCISKDRILLLPYVKREEMLALQSHSHIGACFQKQVDTDIETKMMAPNKIGEYLAKGLYLMGFTSQYMLPLGISKVASLAADAGQEEMNRVFREALFVVKDRNIKEKIFSFVKEYFSMQQQIAPLLNFLRNQ